MIKRIAHKLKSHAGATIVFAMAVFVLVSIVSVSMLTVPLNAAASGKTQKDNEQIRLSLASAAGLLRDCLVDQTLSYTWTKGEGERVSGENLELSVRISEGTLDNWTQTVDGLVSTGLPSLVKELVERVAKVEEKEKAEINLTVELENAVLAAKMTPVTAELTMDTEYNLTAKFTVTANGGTYSITQYFGMSVITPYRMDEDRHVETKKKMITTEEGEEKEVTTEKITYSYEGHWELSWPLENYRVSA